MSRAMLSAPAPQPFAPVTAPRVCVVLPAFNAERTLEATLRRLQPGSYHSLILVDDVSVDRTVEIARALSAQGFDINVHRHEHNRGYGANQKTCYTLALRTDADIIVMLHPDNQYDAALIPYMVGFIATGVVDIVLGSRILRRKEVLAGGMPRFKYLGNRLLTITENVVLGFNLPEYHTGFRAYHRRVLETMDFDACSDSFVFDQEFLIQARVHQFRVGAVPVPTYYGPESSSISFVRSVKYGLSTLRALGQFVLFSAGWRSQSLFQRRQR
jgi:glycosyltransferase involved in cell wall biosynthesis